MADILGKILYFETGGKHNTDATLQMVRERAETLGIKQIIVASSHGYTAKKAAILFSGMDVDIIAVTICAGFEELGWTMTPAERTELEKLGIKVLTSIHALGDDVSDALSNTAPNRIIRETLYTFCQGMKVAIEIALMAADAGLVNMQNEVIAVAGTGEGADTALVIKPVVARQFRKLEIREILAKPRSL